MPKGTQRDALEFLLDQHSLDTKALALVNGLNEAINEVREGKRELTAPEIRALSAHFHVSPEVFF